MPHSFKTLPDEGPNRFLLGFDAGRELELDQGPQEIMFRVPGLEINVPLQIIGEKSQPQLKGKQAGAVIEISPVIGGEKTPGLGEIALKQGLTDVFLCMIQKSVISAQWTLKTG